jgi:hypothetical protein
MVMPEFLSVISSRAGPGAAARRRRTTCYDLLFIAYLLKSVNKLSHEVCIITEQEMLSSP